MSVESQILVNNFGFSDDFAQKLILFTKGDVEAAIRIIEASEKDIAVIKAKFISSKRMDYGGFIFFYNFQTNLPEYIFAVVSNDVNVSRINIDNSWREVYVDLAKYMAANDSDADLASKIESQVLFSDNLGYITSFFVDKNAIDMTNIKRFFLSEVSKVLMDTRLILKLVQEDADIFRVKTFLNSTKFGYKLLSKNQMNMIVLLNLKIEPVLAPIGGVDIDQIQLNDEVLVKVTDDREIARYAINFVDPAAFSTGAVYGKLVFSQKSAGTENTMAILEFGTGIYGRFIIGGKVRIQTRIGEHKKEDSGSKSDVKGVKKDNLPVEEFTLKENIWDSSQSPSPDDTGDQPKKSGVVTVIWIVAIVIAAFLFIVLWIVS